MKPSTTKTTTSTKLFSILLLLLMTQCNLGHKEVKYTEMAAPPKLYIKDDYLIVHTENSVVFPSFLIYEIQTTFDQGDSILYLRGWEGRGRPVKKEFKVNINPAKPIGINNYKIYWVDPDNRRTELKIIKE